MQSAVLILQEVIHIETAVLKKSIIRFYIYPGGSTHLRGKN
jgi:hypothetical protein